jgi:hypothetical protein
MPRRRASSRLRSRRDNTAEEEEEAGEAGEGETTALARIEQHMAAQNTALLAIAAQLTRLNDVDPGLGSTHNNNHTSPSSSSSWSAEGGPARRVYCRFSWFQLDGIDLVKHTFHCKGYFEATWHDPALRDAESGALAESQDVDWSARFLPQILFANKAGDLTHDFEKYVVNAKATEQFGGRAMASYQTVFHGDFTADFSLQQFPYDVQTFEIVVGTGHTVRNVVFVPNPHIHSSAPGIGRFSLNDTWALHLMDGVDGMRTLPNIKGVMGDRSRCATSLRARRRPQFFEVNILLMNFIIILLCFTMFCLPINDIADRMTIAMTAMLTSVAFKTYVADQLPDLSYLTFLDKYLLLGIVMLVVMVVETVCVNAIGTVGAEQKQSFDRQFGGAAFVVFLLGNLWAFNRRLGQCCGSEAGRGSAGGGGGGGGEKEEEGTTKATTTTKKEQKKKKKKR